jgi:hypothetical protein
MAGESAGAGAAGAATAGGCITPTASSAAAGVAGAAEPEAVGSAIVRCALALAEGWVRGDGSCEVVRWDRWRVLGRVLRLVVFPSAPPGSLAPGDALGLSLAPFRLSRPRAGGGAQPGRRRRRAVRPGQAGKRRPEARKTGHTHGLVQGTPEGARALLYQLVIGFARRVRAVVVLGRPAESASPARAASTFARAAPRESSAQAAPAALPDQPDVTSIPYSDIPPSVGSLS